MMFMGASTWILLVICFCLINSSSCDVFENCGSVHGKNLNQLSGSWEAHYDNDTVSNVYIISICSGLSQPSHCEGGSICMAHSSSHGNLVSYGDFSKPPQVVAASPTAASFYLDYNTTRLCQTTEQGTYFYRSSITFECSKKLGSPVVISSDNCSVDFLWETSLACAPSTHDATKEVRCYAYDADGKKRDLDSLIKRDGGYFVKDPSSTTSNNNGVYINVCRDIKTIDGDASYATLGQCPSGSAACLITNGHAYALGSPSAPLNITNENRLVLEYAAEVGASIPPDCTASTPRVVVTFVCPGNNRGGSKPPIVTSSINCQYTIEWWTEAACSVDFITSGTCGLDSQSHGVDLDLSPLTINSTNTYTVHTQDSSNTSYILNVCAATHTECGSADSTSNTVCQISDSNQDGYIAGKLDDYKVKYVDGQLSLTYIGGQRCHNGFRRSSVILFHCNKSAGIGMPTFNHELHCTYYFDWQTSSACLAGPPTCHLTDDAGQSYDLSPLTKIRGDGVENWQVLNGQDLTVNRKRFFINICGEILRDRVTTGCPEGSSVCLLEGNEEAISYGSFVSSRLTKQNNKLVLDYEGGGPCSSGKQKSTRIIFYCRLGDLESSPVFKYVSTDQCNLVLTWHTAAACPLKTVTGTNCVISDEDSGLTFDLQRLTKSSEMYQIDTSGYKYYLNVCDQLSGTPCDDNERHSAVCQVESSGDQRYFILGEKSRELTYYNGFIKLLYQNGDSYSDHHHNRSAQISFLCDNNAGAGHPQFVKEGNHTYVFNWYTAYVCPAASTQCMVEDSSGTQYDLSSLARSEDDQDANWSVLGEEVPGRGRSKYYLNVCRPVNEVLASTNHDLGCDGLTGACETVLTTEGKEEIMAVDLGRPTTGPQLESPDHLVLTYTGGMACTEDKVEKKFQTRIHFVCQKGALSSSPRFLERTNCSVSFEWNTEAACPIAFNNGKDENTLCEVKGPNSQYIFNLQPLQRKPDNPYIVTASGLSDQFELNICGTVHDCADSQHPAVAGCRMAAVTGGIDQRVNHSTPAYSDDGRLTIKYRSLKRDAENHFLFYEVTFVCNRSITKGSPKLTDVDGNQVRFDFATSLACEPEAVDCLVTDDYGNQYDLSPLSSADHPWDVVDQERAHHYYISVCRPLPPISGCKGGASGACYTYQNDTGQLYGVNLGLVQSNPQAVSNGGQGSALSITYMGGDICEHETTRRYSTRILFQCSDVQGSAPVLQTDNTDKCEFFFIWQTPAACPITKVTSSSGEDCIVTDPLYHMTFNLSPLTKTTDYKVVTGGEWDFDVNICSKLKDATGACKESGSCQVKNADASSMNDAGKPNSTLSYEDGVVSLTYLHGRSCHQGKYERSSTFRFTCHHSDNHLPTFINETDECRYLFDWPTPKVCPPIKMVECLAQDSQGNEFDLSTLSLTSDNYAVATHGDTAGRTYYINVCRSMLHRPGVTCPPNSAACVKTADNRFFNLGQLTSGPTFADNKLQITYSNGDACPNHAGINYTTTVTFQCDMNAAVNTIPVVTEAEDSCHVQILWITKAACAVDRNTPTVEQQSTPCAAVNPRTGHLFNFTSLASNTSYEITADDGRIFHMNVCKKVTDANCPDNTGNCIRASDGSFYSGGRVSDKLTYNDGSLILTYKGGKACEVDPSHQHSSVISFVCHRSTSAVMHEPTSAATKPVFVSDDTHTCTHYYSWHTHLACELQNPCSVVNTTSLSHHIIDLSPLISESGHYVALPGTQGTQAAYYINVCRPLEPIHGVACPPGSAACEVKPGQVPQTLGYVDPVGELVSYDSQSETVTLRYISSRSCPTSSNTSMTVSTRIVFSCQPGVDSNSATPRLTEVTSDCVYLFEWGTDLLCSPDASTPSSPSACAYTDASTGNTYDLSRVSSITIHDVNGKFEISPCKAMTDSGKCKNAAACFTSTSGQALSLGDSSTRKLSGGATSQVPVQMVFKNGDACLSDPDLKRQIRILFRCDGDQDAADGNKPTIVYDNHDQCVYILYWPTPYVCPEPSKSCVATYAGGTYDLSLLSSLTHAWSFKDADGNSYYMNLCRPLHSSWTHGCKDDATVCRVLKGNAKSQSLGVLRSQAIIVTTPTTITVRYSGGDRGLCTDSSMASSVVISFVCDPAITGGPQFQQLSQDDCVFHVTWKSRIACADRPETVTPDSTGKFVDPKSGSTIDISTLMAKTWIAKGDVREDNSGPVVYNYAINLRGHLGTSVSDANVQQNCVDGTAVCQYKARGGFARTVGELSPTPPSYVMTDESLEINISSSNPCHKNPNKKSHVVISIRCSHYSGEGNPTFVYESNECGYFIQWFTSVMCPFVSVATLPPSNKTSLPGSSAVDTKTHEANDRHSRSSAVVVSVFVTLGILCLLILVFRKAERRHAFSRTLKRTMCCAGKGASSYRYIRSGDMDDEEGTSLFDDDILMQEETSLLATTSKLHGSGLSSAHPVDMNPIGGAIDYDDLEEDLFEIPEVEVKETKRKKGKTGSGRRKSRPKDSSTDASVTLNPFDDEEDDLLSFVKTEDSGRKPGVGGEVTKSYHDDDDDDMLDA